MANFYDIAYWLAMTVSAPYWLIRPKARRKVRLAFAQRMGHVTARQSKGPAVWIHAVSVGELNATRAMIEQLQAARPELSFIVSTTTQTGYDRGQQLYGATSNISLIRYPLDFSRAINRALDSLRPSMVVLMELEIWPNFVWHCFRRGIPILLANGRLTLPSYQRYKLARPIVSRMLRRIASLCVQDETYAQRFIDLGARPESVHITGTMKFDNAPIADCVEGDVELATAVGLKPGHELIWVCGSTGPGEEEIVLAEYANLLASEPRLRLAIIPRHPERFNQVAELIRRHRFNVVRRSDASQSGLMEGAAPTVILGDTMGELRKFYSLADVVFVGRSLVDLGARQHGSDMIEPAALGKPVIVGPFTANFVEVVRKLVAAGAIREVADGNSLRQTIAVLCSNPTDASAMGARAKEVVRRGQGVTARHVQAILDVLDKIAEKPENAREVSGVHLQQ